METNFLEAMQGTYGNVSKTLAELGQLGVRFGLDEAGVLAVLEDAERHGQGRLTTRRDRNGRWAVFLKGE